MSFKHLPLKSGKVLDLMGSMYSSMTPSAKRICDYVKNHAEKVTQITIAELSTNVQVGEATIIRFCRMLGFRGFQDFKMDLAIELTTNGLNANTILDTNILKTDNIELISQKLQQSINKILSETVNLIDFETLEKVTKKIYQARGIYFFGVGSSGLTAEDAKNKFMRIGFNVDALTNNHFMYSKASLLQEEDLAIGISHSGNSKETIKALKLAREAGAQTLALTHNPRSKICEYAELVLLNGNRQGRMQGDSIGTKFAQLFVLELIYAKIVNNNPVKALSKKQKTMKALEDQ